MTAPQGVPAVLSFHVLFKDKVSTRNKWQVFINKVP